MQSDERLEQKQKNPGHYRYHCPPKLVYGALGLLGRFLTLQSSFEIFTNNYAAGI